MFFMGPATALAHSLFILQKAPNCLMEKIIEELNLKSAKEGVLSSNPGPGPIFASYTLG